MGRTRRINRLSLFLGMGIAFLGLLLGTSPAYADDTGAGDTGLGDIGAGDFGGGDAGLGDAGTGDTGLGDAGFVDTGTNNAGLGDAGTGDAGDNGNAVAATEGQEHNTFRVEITAEVDGEPVDLDQIPAGANVDFTVTVTKVSTDASQTGCVVVEIPDGFEYVPGSLDIALQNQAKTWTYYFYQAGEGAVCDTYSNDSIQATAGNWGQTLQGESPPKLSIEMTFTATAPEEPGDYTFLAHAWLAQKPGEGGGGAATTMIMRLNGGVTRVSTTVDDVLCGDCHAYSPQELHLPFIESGTRVLDSRGDLARFIEITPADVPPSR